MDRKVEACAALESARKAFDAEHKRWKALARQNEGKNRALLAERGRSFDRSDPGAEAERAAKARVEELARKLDDACKAYVSAGGYVEAKDMGLIKTARAMMSSSVS